MFKANVRRTLVGATTLLTAIFQLGGQLQPEVALADFRPPILINEINWAGASGNPADQWIELRNTSPDSYSFSSDGPLDLYNGTTLLARLDSGFIPANGHFLISRLPRANSTLGVSPDLVEASLALPTANAHYLLKDSNGEIIDSADDGEGAPLAGASATHNWPFTASMSRSASGGWYTARTIGAGFDNDVVQYGTPADNLHEDYLNSEVAQPTNLTISPLEPTSDSPVIGGQASAGVEKVRVVFLNLLNAKEEDKLTRVEDDGNFSVSFHSLNPGIYRVLVQAQDKQGNRSAPVTLVIPGSPQNAYVINETSPVTVVPPVLDAYPALVNTTQVTLTGTSQAGSLVVTINDRFITTGELAPGQTRFSLPVTLLTDTLNKIEVRAKVESVTSAPAVVEITHDGQAPAFLGKPLIMASNPKGISDTLAGEPGTVEPHSLIEIYSDAALTSLLTSGMAAADGSFGPFGLGDDLASVLYVIVKDAAGNRSLPLVVENPVSLAGVTVPELNIVPAAIAPNQITLKWQPVPGAVDYLLRYQGVGGGMVGPISLCPNGIANCAYEKVITGLKAGTKYTFTITAVDRLGKESAAFQQNISTRGLVQPAVSHPGSTSTFTGRGGNPQVSPTSPSEEEKPTDQVIKQDEGLVVDPEANQPDESGDVKSAEDAAQRNWTPWIILAVLIGLAVLATTGYFYWFGGEAGDAALASALAEKERREAREAESNIRSNEKTGPPNDKQSGRQREKRW